MAANTNISWADHTLNWWWGCTEVTDECDNCYAKEFASNRLKIVGWGKGEPRLKIKSAPADIVRFDRRARAEGKMAKVFPHSMSDLFDQEVPEEWREEELDAWCKTTNLWFLVLTKRPGMAKKYNYPSDKVWLGTSIGQRKNMIMANKLVEAPAKLHWVSYAPVIEKIDVRQFPKEIKWIVIEGESGVKARPFNMNDVAEVIAMCRDLGIAVHVKQIGSNPVWNGSPYKISDKHGLTMDDWPDVFRVQDYPSGI